MSWAVFLRIRSALACAVRAIASCTEVFFSSSSCFAVWTPSSASSCCSCILRASTGSLANSAAAIFPENSLWRWISSVMARCRISALATRSASRAASAAALSFLGLGALISLLSCGVIGIEGIVLRKPPNSFNIFCCASGAVSYTHLTLPTKRIV